MAAGLEPKQQIIQTAGRATGTITVAADKQTCWFCSDNGYILTAGHIFYGENKALKKSIGKEGDSFKVYFNEFGELDAKLVEAPYLEEHLDFAVLRLTEKPTSVVPCIPLCAHEGCRLEGTQLLLYGYRGVLGEGLTNLDAAVTTLQADHLGVVTRLHATLGHGSSVAGLSGAAACAICQHSQSPASIGLQARQAVNAKENIFAVPSARMIAASPTLQALCEPLSWTSRENRLKLLSELRDAISKQESSKAEWIVPDKRLDHVFHEVVGACFGPNVTCSACGQCILAFLGEPNPRRLVEEIEEEATSVIVLHGSGATGKTKSSDSLHVAKQRSPFESGAYVRLARVDAKSALDGILSNNGDDANPTVEAVLDKFLVDVLGKAMAGLAYPGSKFKKRNENERREWSRRALKNSLLMMEITDESAAGDLLLGLQAVLAAIAPEHLGSSGTPEHFIIYLDNADAIDLQFSALQLPDGRPCEPVNDLLKNRPQPDYPTQGENRQSDALKNRHIVVATRQVQQIISSQEDNYEHPNVRLLSVRDVSFIDEDHILCCLRSLNSDIEIEGANDWEKAAHEIHALTEGYPWYVHRFVLFLDCILRNAPELHVMKAVRALAAANYFWTHKAPFQSRKFFLRYLNAEIDCLSKNKMHNTDGALMHRFALQLIEEAKSADLESILSGSPSLGSMQGPNGLPPKPLDVAIILPAVQRGLLAERRRNGVWSYSNKLVEMHFGVKRAWAGAEQVTPLEMPTE